MSIVSEVGNFLSDSANWSGPDGVPQRILEHCEYTGMALGIAVVIAVPIGLYIGHTGRGAFIAINAGNAGRSLPTLGVLTLVVLIAGIGITPALVALVVLAIPPLLTNTYAGIRAVDRLTVDAARGTGMREKQILLRVEVPMALPLMFSGLRSAALQVIATATVAAYVALGGLGRFVLDGLAVHDYGQMVAGALFVAALAIFVDLVLATIQRLVVSPGVSGRVGTGTTRSLMKALSKR